jgi:type IV secretory pathway VirB4 component
MATNAKQDAGNSLDLVDIKEIKGNTVIVKDGSFRQIIMVGGVNFSLKSDSEQSIITQAYQTFLNSIDFPLQIVIHSRKVNIDQYLQTLLVRKEAESSPILQNQISEYVEFIRGFVQKNAIMEKNFLVVVSFYPVAGEGSLKSASSAFSSLPFFGKKKTTPAAQQTKNKDDDDKTFKEHLEQLNQRTSQVTSGLLGIGLEATVLENEQLIELFYNFYNPQTIERKNVIAAAPQK